MASIAEFTPPFALRIPEWPNPLLALVGERRRDTAYGWPEASFDVLYKQRSLLGTTIHLANDPDFIGHVLLHNEQNYVKPDFLKLILKPTIGRGLFTAERDEWRNQRKIVAPSFAPTALTELNARIAEVAERQVASWPPTRTRIDVAEQAQNAAMAVISDALFSGDERLTSPVANAHMTAILGSLGKSPLTIMMGLPEFSLRPSFWRGYRGRSYLRNSIGAMIDERIALGRHDDFFGGLIRSLYGQFEPAEARALAIDNALTFYVAGHETTAVALSWTTYLLAAQPTLQEEVRAEARAALSGDAATLPDRLPLLRQIIEESMRLYPPLHRIERQAIADDEVCGTSIKTGDVVSIWPMILHRHRALWARPDVFDHNRFSPEGKAAQRRFQYIPFGAGPRICVGARLAMVEALVVMAHWLAARRFETVQNHIIRPIGGVTLRPQNGMPLMVG
jgi:cytochrome P450